MSDMKIQWHPGFVAAMDLEFEENRKDLVYEKEYNLNTKPLEIDLLVIKKEPGVQIVNEIGKLFRGHNIVEYKSPEDHMDIDTFYKAGAYGSLYKALGSYVDERKADDITVTIIRDAKPEGLFQYFIDHHIKVTNPFAGIYYIEEAVVFPTQIIVGRELKRGSHTWLKALSGRMRKQEMRDLLEKIEGLTKKFDKELADSVLEVSVRANKQVVEELRGDERMYQALMEIMEPEINQIVGAATEKAVKEAKAAEKAAKAAKAAEKAAKEEAKAAKEEAKAAKEEAKEAATGTVLKMLKSEKFTVEEIHDYVPQFSIEEIEVLGRG